MKKGRSFDLVAKALVSTSSASKVTNQKDCAVSTADSNDASCSNVILARTTRTSTLSKRSSSSISSSSSSSSSSRTSAHDFDSDDSVKDKNYIPPQIKDNNPLSSDSEDDFIQSSPRNNILISEPQIKDNNPVSSDSADDFIENSPRNNNITIPESPERDDFEPEMNDDSPANPVELTKKGTIRKRKHYTTSLEARKKAAKILKNDTKYCVKPGCGDECKKKCSSNISESHRFILNKQFRSYSFREQHIYIRNNTSQTKPTRRTQRKNEYSRKIERSKTVTYFLSNETGEKITVCKIFFLTTLGFNPKNDKVLRNALKRSQDENVQDMRGSNPNPNKINNDEIIEHINSFHPALSHYRREHAPLRKYLPADINVRSMHNDFLEKKGITDSTAQDYVSYDHYRRVVKQLNISFARLGNEECELCAMYTIHNPNPDIRHRNCSECKEFEIHHKRYILAREQYNADKIRQINSRGQNSDTIFYSVDLEKVIMCPRMDEFKVVMFCPRLILFNESFVPLGDKKLDGASDTFACIWHEAISGRKKDDITSCFRAFFAFCRDLKHVILWLDNCASQNKNWALFSYLVFLVNSSDSNFETITLKYLEVGHTFMSADEFHHQVELALRRKKRIYDFEDFHRAVSDTHRNITVKCMDVNDFCKFEDCSSQYKLQNLTPRPYLNKMCEIKFQRGHKTMAYKTDFDGIETEVDFLRMKNIKIGIPCPVIKTEFRGIHEERKAEIINKLVPLMPENRRAFWYNLPCNNNSVNLTTDYEE